jgi:hypothetical protein
VHATKAWKESEGQFGKDKDRRLTMIQPTEPIVDSVVPRTSGQRGRPQLPQGRVVRAEAVGLLERGRVRLLLLLSGPLRLLAIPGSRFLRRQRFALERTAIVGTLLPPAQLLISNPLPTTDCG